MKTLLRFRSNCRSHFAAGTCKWVRTLTFAAVAFSFAGSCVVMGVARVFTFCTQVFTVHQCTSERLVKPAEALFACQHAVSEAAVGARRREAPVSRLRHQPCLRWCRSDTQGATEAPQPARAARQQAPQSTLAALQRQRGRCCRRCGCSQPGAPARQRRRPCGGAAAGSQLPRCHRGAAVVLVQQGLRRVPAAQHGGVRPASVAPECSHRARCQNAHARHYTMCMHVKI